MNTMCQKFKDGTYHCSFPFMSSGLPERECDFAKRGEQWCPKGPFKCLYQGEDCFVCTNEEAQKHAKEKRIAYLQNHIKECEEALAHPDKSSISTFGLQGFLDEALDELNKLTHGEI